MRIGAVLLGGVTLIAVGSALCVAAVAGAAAPPCGEWTWLNPLPQGSDLFSVRYGGGRYVAVGRDGAVLVSADGVNWTVRNLDPPDSLFDVAWGSGRFVAVGDGIWTSPDGFAWTREPLGSGSAMAWDGQEFLVSNGRYLVRSADGVAWQTIAFAPNGLVRLVSGESQWLGVGRGVAASSDGINWNTALWPLDLWDITWTGVEYVAVGAMNRHGLVLRSRDASSWVISTTDQQYGDSGFLGVAVNGSGLLAVTETAILGSADGRRWVEEFSDPSLALYRVAAGPADAVAVGYKGALVRRDAAGSWTPISRGAVADLNGIERVGDELLVAGGTIGSNGVILSRRAGGEWQTLLETPDFSPPFNAVTRRGSTYVAVGNDGTVMTSDGGANWALATGIPSDTWLYAVTSDGPRFVAVGSRGLIASSENGSQWTVRAHDASSAITLRDVVWNGSLFVAVGGGLAGAGPTSWGALNALVMSSPDGASWTVRYEGSANPGLVAVAWSGQRFVAVGGTGDIGSGTNGVALTSSDGLSWTVVPHNGGFFDSSDVAWDGTQFEVLVNSQKLLRSPDGLNWTDDGTISPGWIQSIVAAPGEIIAVGSGGRILRRACTPAQTATARHERSSTCVLGTEDSHFQVRSATSTAPDPGNAPR